jgi:type VI secretion system protein ImpL
MKLRLAHLQRLANVAGVALLLWLVAPLWSRGGAHPFDSVRARVLGLVALGTIVLAVLAVRQVLRTRRNARLFEQLQGADAAASEALSERFRAAMQLLRAGIAIDGKRSGGWRDWFRGRRQVYQLPWYLIIGAPGAGKTTALLHSGLRFPLAERLGAAPLAGVGGTRQCDWWFTDRAVFLDTAGRYTTQDSHAASDAQEWRLFLRLLRRHRPVQPVNGVIVTVSVPDLLNGGAELDLQAAAVDRRLQELRGELGLSFSVYLLVTKADLLAGFVEFFGDFDAAQREQPWGLSFEYPVPAGAGALPSNLSAQLAAMAARVASLSPQRLQQEPQVQRRAAIHHFAAQVEAILPALEGFARRAFVQAAAAPSQVIRGIHLSSGTQEGNPIDRVLGELARSYGMAVRTLPRPDGGGKAYFLAALLQQLVIGEAPLAGSNLVRQRRRRWLLGGGAGALAGVLVLACVGWWVSYRSNVEYVESVRQRVQQLAREAANLPAGRIDTLLPLYELLSQLARSGTVDPSQAPAGFGFGLFQGPRLAQAADQTYHRVLDQTLAPLLVERLSRALRQETDAAARYDALRITLMLVAPERLQRNEVRRWAAEAIAAPGVSPSAATAASEPGVSARGVAVAPGRGEQQEWLRHLDALLERNAVLQVVRLDDALVSAARASVASVPFAQRVHERLLGRARERMSGAHGLVEVAGPGAVLAFAPQDAGAALPNMPGVLTRQAWREVIEPELDATIQELAEEAGWVLGDRAPGLQRLVRERDARDEVARQVAQRHAQAVVGAWERLLSGLALQPPADGDALIRLASGLAANDSPLRALMSRLASEFAPVAPGGASGAGSTAFDAVVAARFGALAEYARGPGAAALARLLEPLPAVAREPTLVRSVELTRELRAEAARAPTPLREVWTVLGDALGSQQRKVLDRQLAGSFAALSQSCRRLVDERFPFAASARRDMPMADFAQLFGPQGLLDDFFRVHLAAQVDTSRRPWRLAGGAAPQGRTLASLRAFEMAADIRRLFFAAGGPLPQLQLRLTPVRMDEELLQFSIDVDGQLLRYENGPRRSKLLLWPGPAATQRVLMRIFPAGPSGVDAEVHEGPWALLRVLRTANDGRPTGGAPAVQLAVDGRRLNLEAATDAPVAAGLLGELTSFRCPEGW